MKATVEWKGKMSFSGTSDSGFSVDLGTYTEFGGDDDGFRPLELMAISLAGCTAMGVISILKKKRQDVTAFKVKVDAARTDSHPKVFTNAKIHYLVTGKNIDEKAVLRAIQLSAERYCPAQSMLAQVFPMELFYQIFSEDNKLIGEGTFHPE